MKLTLKRHEILKKRECFQIVFNKGKRLYGKHLSLIILPYKYRLVGFTVTKSCKLASQRNRIKRLLREIYRRQKHIFKKCIIIIHARTLYEMNYNILKEDFQKIIKRLQKIDKKNIYCSH